MLDTGKMTNERLRVEEMGLGQSGKGHQEPPGRVWHRWKLRWESRGPRGTVLAEGSQCRPRYCT